MGNDASVALRDHGCPHIGAWPSVHGVLPAPAIKRAWGMGNGEWGNDAGVARRNHGCPHVGAWPSVHGVLPAPAILRSLFPTPYSPFPAFAPQGFGPCPSLSSHFRIRRVTKRYTGLPVANQASRSHEVRLRMRRSTGVIASGQ